LEKSKEKGRSESTQKQERFKMGKEGGAPSSTRCSGSGGRKNLKYSQEASGYPEDQRIVGIWKQKKAVLVGRFGLCGAGSWVDGRKKITLRRNASRGITG